MTTKLNVRQAFVIGYAVWLLPTIGRWATAGANSRKVVYEALWELVFFVLGLAIISVVYARATARGKSLHFAAVVSMLATIPLIVVLYGLDAVITARDPSLAFYPPPSSPTLGFVLFTSITDSAGIMLLLAAIVFLPLFARAHAERMRELELANRDAELLRIRAHLEPHFVLNSLNAVAGLVEEEPAQARELLAALGDLFREAASFRPIHTVADEMEWLRRYVAIHELRHPEALSASWDVDAACLDLECPALILQPLVENAVKHGALRGGGHLAIAASVQEGRLSFVIADDGPGIGPPRPGAQGLSIVARRLALDELPEDAFTLAREGGRTVARVRLPARTMVRHA